MAERDKPNTSTQRKPASSSDELLKTDKEEKGELTDTELKKISGGIQDDPF
jgi:bacteriocin-like protein